METLGPPIQLPCGAARLVRQLGEGGSGQAWLVELGGQQRTLKVVSAEHSRVLASEAQRLVLARSQWLPQALAVGCLPQDGPLPSALHAWRGSPYLLLSYAAGVDLREATRALEPHQRQALASAVARDIGQALDDLHSAGVAHGDVKPQNVITVGEGDAFRCQLIDLGLAGAADAPAPSGATLRYLAPEVAEQRPTDARSRDMWALGITLLEVLNPEAARSSQPLAHLDACEARWRHRLSALLNENPAARPRAQWLVRQAAADDSTSDAGRWRARTAAARIERAYLHVRRHELLRVAAGRRFAIEVGGEPAHWLRQACQALSQLNALHDRKRNDAGQVQVFADLSAAQRHRFLLHLIGSSSVEFPPLPPRTDAALVQRLLELSGQLPLEAIPLSALLDDQPPVLTTAVTHDATNDPSALELALRLGAETPDDLTLDAVEQWAHRGGAPEQLVLAAARALKRHHELARSRALLTLLSGPEAALDLAAVDARTGNFEQSKSRLLQLLRSSATSPQLKADAQALLARLHLSRGDTSEAERVLADAPTTATTLEGRASVALTQGQLDAAEGHLWRASALARGAEQRARLEALFANLHQQRGDSRRALDCFRRAAEHAARARAILEEATYLAGVSATACNLGQTGEALVAAERAVLLFDWLDNEGAAARAELARATALAVVGAQAEAREAIQACLSRARRTNDRRCQLFAHLLACDVSPELHAVEHLERARRLLPQERSEDQLRVAARQLRCNQLGTDERRHFDVLARGLDSPDARLEWWGARAAAALDESNEALARGVLTELSRLLPLPAAVDTRGEAFAHGARLAARLGEGSGMRQLTAAALDAQHRIESGAPPQLRLAARQLPWAHGLARSPSETDWRPEQLHDIERLIQALGERERLSVLLDRVLDALVAWTGVQRGLLLLRTPSGNLKPRAARNLARQDLRGEQLELSTSLAQRALESSDCVVAMDASCELPALHRSIHSLKLRSVLAVPLIARGQTLGVVYLDDRTRAGAFGQAEMAWVRFAAQLAALAIADARDQLLLRRAARRAQRAEQRMEAALAQTHAELEVAERELSRQQPRGYRYRYDEIVGESAAVHAMLKLLDRVTASEIPVLIAGESGSGKELVARAIHRNGSRHARPFVGENCSAIPDGLLESMLFGHVKGAFTGASRQHAGLFEVAHQGTLFLDEIADMSLAMQSKLLRVLESGEVRRVGSERPIRVDVRVIGASHKHLPDLVAQGLFRQDLYYRLNVITIEVPALRQRRADIPLLVRHFLDEFATPPAPVVTPEAMALLEQHSWPGNVRELQNEIRRAIVLCDGVIDVPQLTLSAAPSDARPRGLNLRQHVDQLELQLIQTALRDTGGNQTRAAELLGVSRFGLQKMLKRLGIHSPRSRAMEH